MEGLGLLLAMLVVLFIGAVLGAATEYETGIFAKLRGKKK